MKQMKMLLVVFGLLMFTFGTVSIAAAVPVQFSYTADNQITGWTIEGSGQLLGSNASDWTKADNTQVDLTPGQYDIIWQVKNWVGGDYTYPTNWGANPVAFLGEISFSGTNLLSSTAWETSVDNSTWDNAVAYGTNSDTSTIWYTHNGPGSVANIAGDAEWISVKASLDEYAPSDLYVKTTIDVPAPVPEPATLFLLGTGLIGLAGLGRRKFKKNNMV